MASFGYVRVSSKDQNVSRQVEALQNAGIEESYLFIDKVSGKNTERPELQKLLNKVRAGDKVTVKSVDRLARNTKDLLSLLEELTTKGVSVYFLDNSMMFDDSPTSKFMITMLGAVGELERSFIRQRQQEGIAIAKAKGGVFKGKARDEELHTRVKSYLTNSQLSADEIAKLCECGRATVFRIKKEIALS
ncbi:recombinase family protein [Yersinia enterocolitica]|uniref:recombinase family protein n=1 Tax=Yersinia TaxID=629 RepID=UPI001D0F58FB|nr:recombinase family protein [Yersinia proxima]HDL7502837.1 recombinase family protein [Yersinia enterocolitica]